MADTINRLSSKTRIRIVSVLEEIEPRWTGSSDVQNFLQALGDTLPSAFKFISEQVAKIQGVRLSDVGIYRLDHLNKPKVTDEVLLTAVVLGGYWVRQPLPEGAQYSTTTESLFSRVNVILEEQGLDVRVEPSGVVNLSPVPETVEPARRIVSMVRVFISHSSKDGQAAEAIGRALEDAIPALNRKSIRCTSADRYSLRGGTPAGVLKEEVKSCTVVILVVSKAALESPWTMFEMGAAWSWDLHIVPFLTSSGGHENLPGPIKDLNCHALSETARVSEDIGEIAAKLGLSVDHPELALAVASLSKH